MTGKYLKKIMRSLVATALVQTPLLAQSAVTASNDSGQAQNTLQQKLEQKLEAKRGFRSVKVEAENGVLTLTGTVDLYQQKLNAAKLARKLSHAQNVRNLITVAGANISDDQLAQELAKKLIYVRAGYDNAFDYFAISVKDGVVRVTGEDRTGVGRDEALADLYNQPGVKDVVSEISVAPASPYDDGIRLREARAIYRDPVLSRYAIDPAHPIRIVVENGHVTLYGSVDSKMERSIAGIRANQVFGAFSVDNKLAVKGIPADQLGM